MISYTINPGTLQSGGYYNYDLTTSLNTTGEINVDYFFTIWISGINAGKPASGDEFSVYVGFWTLFSNQIQVINSASNEMYLDTVRATFIFFNYVATTIAGSYRLP